MCSVMPHARSLLILPMLVVAGPVFAQAVPAPIDANEIQAVASAIRPEAVTIPDSVRRKVGYQHWKGGAIGAALGGLAGLLLTQVAPISCDDCTSDDSHTLEAVAVGAGLAGAFGFLVGAASPKYSWVPRSAEVVDSAGVIRTQIAP